MRLSLIRQLVVASLASVACAASDDGPGLPLAKPGDDGAPLLPPVCHKVVPCKPDPRVPILDNAGKPVLGPDGNPTYYPNGNKKGDQNCKAHLAEKMLVMPLDDKGNTVSMDETCAYIQIVLGPNNTKTGGDCGPAKPSTGCSPQNP